MAGPGFHPRTLEPHLHRNTHRPRTRGRHVCVRVARVPPPTSPLRLGFPLTTAPWPSAREGLERQGHLRDVLGSWPRPRRSPQAPVLPHTPCPSPPSLPRCACIDVRHAHKASRKWTLEMDVALVQYINRLCRHLAITPARLHPHEVYLDPADASDPRVACLLSR